MDCSQTIFLLKIFSSLKLKMLGNMSNKFTSPAGKNLFNLLSYLANLRHTPEALGAITDEDKILLDLALENYQSSAAFLETKIVEPIRTTDETLAEEAYRAIQSLISTTVFLGSILIYSDTLKENLRKIVVKEKNSEVAANARGARANNSMWAARDAAVSQCMKGRTSDKPHKQAKMIEKRVNDILEQGGHRKIKSHAIARIINKNHSNSAI